MIELQQRTTSNHNSIYKNQIVHVHHSYDIIDNIHGNFINLF